MIDDSEVEDFLAHFGVKGMKWGVRRTARIQKIIDRHERVANGTASTKDRLLAANRGVFTARGANRTLQRAANNQAKLNAGKHKTTAILLKVHGVNYKDLTYGGRKGDANAKMDNGQKATVAAIVAIGALRIAGAAAKR